MHPFVMGSFTSHNVFKVRSWDRIYLYFSPFYNRITLHCVDMPHLSVPLSADGCLNCFYFLTAVNSVALNIHVRIFYVDIYFRIFWLCV